MICELSGITLLLLSLQLEDCIKNELNPANRRICCVRAVVRRHAPRPILGTHVLQDPAPPRAHLLFACKVNESLVSETLRYFVRLHFLVDSHHNQRIIVALCRSVQRHSHFVLAEAAGQIVHRHDQNHFSTVVHAVSHVFEKRFPGHEVARVDDVLDVVLVEHWQ